MPNMLSQINNKELFNELFLDSALQAAYVEVGSEHGIKPEEVYFSRRCVDVAQKLVEKFRNLGIEAEVVSYEGFGLVTEHDFIVMKQNGNYETYDATWQQFLDKPNPQAPKVLKADLKNIEARLNELGINKELHPVWTQPINNFVKKHEKSD